MELLDEFNGENCNRFLAILMNSSFGTELITNFEPEIFPKLINALVTNKDIDQHFQLGLAFVNNDTFRERFFSIQDRLCADDLISKRRMYVLAIAEKKHFIEMLINCDDATRGMLSNNGLNESLFIVQSLFNIDQLKDRKLHMQEISQLSTCSTDNSFKSNILNELQRLMNLEEMLISHIPNIRLTSYASKFNVIDILYENMNLSTIDSQLVHSILQENSKYNHRFKLVDSEMGNHLTEMELYNNFLIVKLLLKVIMANQHVTILNESSVEALNEVKILLNKINSIRTLINILDISFSLIFIRWDNLNQNGASIDLDRTSESGSETNKTCIRSKRNEKTAFICSATAIDNILKLLKDLAQQKLHSDGFVNADDLIKKIFRRLYENISDAHRRVVLFYSNVSIAESRSTSFVNDDLRKYFNKHQSHTRESSNASSDEEVNSQHETSVYRRKPRKKNPLRKSLDDKNLVISNSTEHEQKSDTLYRSVSTHERRCPVSRMLGSHEHLATVCLNNGNIEDAKEIVKVRFAFQLLFV